MTREEKSQVIETLTAQLSDNANIYLADISGLDAGNTSNLRRACFKAGVQLAVVKNTLLKKAMESSDKDFGELTGDNQLDSLVELKSKDELIGEIIGLLQSPAKNVVSALKSSGGKLAGIVKTLSEREG